MTTTKATQFTFPILLVICLGHFSVDFMLGIWPVFKTLAGLDVAVAGFLAGGSVIVAEGMQCYFGLLCDRGYQRVLLLCGIAFATAACLFSYSQSYFFLWLYFITTCIGSAAFHPTAASILSNIDTKKRGQMMGIFTASGMIGLGISQMLFSWTYQSYNGSTAILAAPSLVLAVLSFLFFKNKVAMSATRTLLPSLSLYLRFFKIKELRALYLTMLGNQIVLWSLVFLLPEFLQERNYSSWTVYGGGHLVLMLGATIGSPLFGYLADRTSLRQVILLNTALTTVSFYLLLIPATLSQGVLFALLFCIGGMLGSIPPLVWALGGQMAAEHKGAVSAFLMGVVWIFSESLGLGLSGYLTTLFTQHAATLSLAAMGVIQLISCYAASRLPKQVEELSIA